MNSIPHELLVYLADGRFHSGEELARQFGVTRTAIWKACKSISRHYGLQIDAVSGRGYRLSHSIELLDALTIQSGIQRNSTSLEVNTMLSVDSTNQYLMKMAANGARHGLVVFAEHQSSGRGRQGRRWVSPFGGNLYFSLLWRFNHTFAEFPALGLVVSLAIVRVLRNAGITDIELKWPNDVLCQRRKLAGVLVEVQGEMSGPFAVVIGVGLNVSMPVASAVDIDQTWIDLVSAGAAHVSRNRLAALLLDEIVDVLLEFTSHGLKPFLAEWQQYDRFHDRPVELTLANDVVKGVARGIDEHGALLVEHNNRLQKFYSGDVRLRAGDS